MVTEMIEKKGDKKLLGVNWVSKFLRPHPNIELAYIPPLDKERAMAQEPEILRGWFELYKRIKDD